MKKTVMGLAALALAGGLATAQAASGDSGWYAGAQLGRSVTNLGAGDLDNAFARQGLGTSSSVDRRDSAWSLFAGYQLNPNLAFEGGWVNLGKFKYASSVSAPAADAIAGHYGVRGVDAAAVGILPLGPSWAAYAKAGLFYNEAKLDAGSSGAVAVSGAHHWSTDPLLGAGVSYDVTRSVSLRGEWDRFFRVGDSGTGRGDIDQYTVGVAFKF